MRKYFQIIHFNHIKEQIHKFYIGIFNGLKVIFNYWKKGICFFVSKDSISYIASIFTILASLSILQYFQVWCYFGDTCEEKLIGHIGYWLQRNYIESKLWITPIIEQSYNTTHIEINNDWTEVEKNIQWASAYYEMNNFYIQIIYNPNQASECVFITAKYGNTFVHPYAFLSNEKIKLNKSSFYDIGWAEFIARDNMVSTYWYIEHYFLGSYWWYLTLYFSINDAGKNNSRKLWIPDFVASDATIIHSWFIYDVMAYDTYWGKIISDYDVTIMWTKQEDKNRIDSERKQFIPNTFWFWNNCENTYGVNSFLMNYKRNLYPEEYKKIY